MRAQKLIAFSHKNWKLISPQFEISHAYFGMLEETKPMDLKWNKNISQLCLYAISDILGLNFKPQLIIIKYYFIVVNTQ